MKFIKTKYGLIFSALAVCFVMSVYLNIRYIEHDRKYEYYLSEQIGNTLMPMGGRMNYAKVLIEQANKNISISKNDLSSLVNCYNIQI